MKINVIAILINSLLIGGMAHAQNYQFNPVFLEGEKGNIADLSWASKGAELPPGKYNVNIYINNSYISTQALSFKIFTDQEGETLLPCLTSAKMDAFGIDLAGTGHHTESADAECLLLSTLFPDTKTDFDTRTLSVYFSVPQRYLQDLPRGYVNPQNREHGITGGWLNYALNGSRSRYQGGNEGLRQDRYFASLHSGINVGPWRLRDYTTLTHSRNEGNQITHIRSWLQRDLPTLQSQLYLGETWTPAALFESVGLLGVQVNTDDNMLPSSQRGYAPDVRGIARSNATVTVRQSGNIVYQTSVPAGEFVLKDLYPTASGGDLQVTIEEENGHITQYTVPFASVPNLVRQGQLKYAIGAGRFRAGYQQDAPLFIQGELFYGWRYGLTFYGGAQFSERYRALAMGAGQNMGPLGALSVDATLASSLLADRQRYHGEAVRLRYSKQLNDYGTRFNFYAWRFSTSGFYDLSDTAQRGMQGGSTSPTANGVTAFNLQHTRKSRNQLQVSQRMGDYGAVTLSWDWQRYWHTEKTTESAMLSWNSSLAGLSWGVGLQSSSQLWSSKRDNILSLSLSLPLGSPSSSTRARYAMTQANTANTTHSVGLSGDLPGAENASYSLMQHYGRQQQYGADMSMHYKGARGHSTLGYSYTPRSHYLSYGLNGGVVLHEDGLTLSQPLGNTNILIKAPGASRVAVRNHKGVETDDRGYAVVPYATPYRVNRVELDVTTAGEHVEIERSVAQPTPTEGALIRATIPTRVGMKAMFFVSKEGAFLPFGTLVSVNGEKQNAGIVGDGGSVYLSGLPLEGNIVARWGHENKDSCTARYRLDDRYLNPQTGLWTQELVCH